MSSELMERLAAQFAMQPKHSLECLKENVLNCLQWIEAVEIQTYEKGKLQITVKHSYPEGVDIGFWVVLAIKGHVAADVGWSLNYVRVNPQ